MHDTPTKEIAALRGILAAFLRRIDHLERRVSQSTLAGDGALVDAEPSAPGPFRIREVTLLEPAGRATSSPQRAPQKDADSFAPDPFALLDISHGAPSEGPGAYHGVRALLGGLAISTPALDR